MRAVVLEKINSPLTVREVDLTPLLAGQVLVRNLVSGLCGAQLHEIRGHKGNEKFLPHLLGHEGCGIVQDVGEGVTTVCPGDKVVMHWRKGTGIEAAFPKYVLDGKEISSGKVTTLSEYSIVSENRLTTVPPHTPEHLCALLGCSMTTALGAINYDANLKFGESILIIGTGGVGLNLIQAASMASAYPISCLELDEAKKTLALSSGATTFTKNINELSEKEYDVIVDTTGNVDIISSTIPLLADRGRYIFIGQPPPGADIIVPRGTDLWSANGKTMKVSQGGCTTPSKDISRYVKLYDAGILNVDRIVTHVFALSEINEAFDLLRTGTAGRIMIRIGEEE
mgnify:CR=1 FL=1